MVIEVQENVPLAEFTTFKIGGAARFFIRAENENSAINGLEYAEKNNLEVFILGGGSNLLISDEGFDGLVLQIALKGVEPFGGEDEKIRVTAQAGEDWDEFVAFCVENNLQGIECLSGIPGCVGGTPVQNVGAYGQEVAETICNVRVYDRKLKRIRDLSNAECGFAYRASVFNTIEKNRYVVLAVTYALRLGGEPKIAYADLKKRFDGDAPNIKEVRKMVCEIRAGKAMLVRQTGADARSAGSFFKNPVVSNEKLAEIGKLAGTFGIEKVPHFAVDERNVKIPAAWLIENSGFPKGYAQGNAGLSTKHALALINRGNAAASEILTLKNEIQSKVREIFGIDLIPEPIFVGFEK